MTELVGVREAAKALNRNPSTISRYLKKHPELNHAPAGAARPKVDADEVRRHMADNVNGAMSGNHAGALFDGDTAETDGAGRERRSQGGVSYSKAKAARETILARRAQIDLDEKLGRLVPRDEMERAFFTCARQVRQKIDLIETWAEPLAALVGADAQTIRGFFRERIRAFEAELAAALKSLPGEEDEDEDDVAA